MYSLLSITASAASLSRNNPINLPQLPTVGFITTGYPIFSIADKADSAENAVIALGVLTPFFLRVTCANSLLPQMFDVSNEFMTLYPRPSSIDVEWTLLK